MSFKEWWKSTSYWTKWAIRGLFIWIIINVILALNSRLCHGKNCQIINIIDLPSFFTSKLLNYIEYLQSPGFADIPPSLESLFIILFNLPYFLIVIGCYLLIGILIGWIVKKIKSKKENS
ncbi:MAG: hypothetical protein PHO02_06730 [Candidatus Nanoarchaeia archaeon]|nr:hypothetical protein [Candidatus Nanoarchaeia archaeon]